MGERIVKTFRSTDNRAVLRIFERDDGFFRFEGAAERTEDGDTYITPSDISGLYGTLEEAERDARTTVIWLRDQLSRGG